MDVETIRPPRTELAPRIALFAHNRFDAGVLKRVDAFCTAGATLSTFSFRRDGANRVDDAEWSDHDLGPIEHRRYAKRIGVYARALVRLWGARTELWAAEVFYARNLDIFLLAWLAATLIHRAGGVRVRLVYESLDVHDSLTRSGIPGATLRMLERRVLARCDLLVVSSPGFVFHYFAPRQDYAGPWHLAENKLVPGVRTVPRRLEAASDTTCLTLVWPGIIRCRRTLILLRGVALAEPDRVRVRIHGRVSRFLIEDFDDQVAGIPNLVVYGPYTWPDGLGDAYRGADLVWAQDFEVEGGNSDWLLPNRLYEAGYFGVPMLAVEGTETGRYVAARSLGYVLTEPDVQSVVRFLRRLDLPSHGRLRESLLTRDASAFVASTDDARALLGACVGAQG